MIDIFEEINLLDKLIAEKQNAIINIMKYMYELLQMSYINEVDYQNADICLEYISYYEYSMLISENLKRIFCELGQELDKYKQEITDLIFLRNSKLEEARSYLGKFNDYNDEYSESLVLNLKFPNETQESQNHR